MDALLILAGLLLILASVFWLSSRAFTISLFWGIGALTPPGWLAFSIRYWLRARPCLLLGGVGVMTLVVGLSMLSQHEPARLARLLSCNWGSEQQRHAPADLDLQLYGEFNGEPFQPDMAELIEGVLIFSQGDELSRRELRLHLEAQPEGQLVLDLLPEDRGSHLPVVELIWVNPDNPLPEARRITHGYTLHMELAPGRINRVEGRFHLVVPGELPTSLTGSLEAYTSRLRYQGDQVDPRHNSRETVEWLLLEHLREVARTPEVEFVRLPPLDINRSRLDLDVDVRVAGELQNTALSMVHDDIQGWHVTVDSRPLVPVQMPAGELASRARAARTEEPPRAYDRRNGFTLERLLSSPDTYRSLRVRVRTLMGGIAEGNFLGLSADGRLQIHYRIGRGEVSFSIRPDDVQRIQLLEP